MSLDYFSRNGEILPIEQAVVPLSSAEYSYGFGVYETLRVSRGTIHFLPDHCRRLMQSADIISLDHNFSVEFVSQSTRALLEKAAAESCNMKVMLIGGQTPETAALYILCLNPLFPNRKLYREGAAAITYEYERDFPQAKTLNMLPSYLAYREARTAGAYDALLINRQGNITEGTRTNFFTMQGRTIFTPPETEILPGVTRHYVLQVAQRSNFQIVEQNIPAGTLNQYDSCFLTSTSSKIMPLQGIGDHHFDPAGESLRELMQAFNNYLSSN